MFRLFSRAPVYRLAGIIPFYEYRDPYDDSDRQPLKPPETAWERVRFLFKYTPDGYVSKEYVCTVQLCSCTFVAAFLVGAVKDGFSAFDKFLTVNQTTKFVSAYEARRKLQDYVIFESMKTGLKYATKCTIFTAITGFVSILIAAYRDKEGILEYVIGAGVAGATVRLYMGAVGAAVGGLVGASLGALIGTMIWGIGELTGVTISDTRDMLYSMKVERDEMKSKMLKAAQEDAYESPSLRKWLKSWKEKGEHKLHDDDLRYVVQPIPKDVELPEGNDGRNIESNKILEDTPKNDSLSNTNTEGSLKHERSDS